MREKREAKHSLAILETEVAHIREKLRKLLTLLENNARLVWFEGISTNRRHFDERESDYLSHRIETFRLSDFDGRRLAELTSQIRDAETEVERLDKAAKKYGISPHFIGIHRQRIMLSGSPFDFSNLFLTLLDPRGQLVESGVYCRNQGFSGEMDSHDENEKRGPNTPFRSTTSCQR